MLATAVLKPPAAVLEFMDFKQNLPDMQVRKQRKTIRW